MELYSFEYHDEDGLAFLTLDNGRQVTLEFLDNKVVVECKDGPFRVEQGVNKVTVDFGAEGSPGTEHQ